MRGIFRGLDIAAAGLRAEMQRSEVVAANISNMHITGGRTREPYRRKTVVFEELLEQGPNATRQAGGVRVKEVVEDRTTPFLPRYDPQDPENKDGWVLTSNVDVFRELVDVNVIARSFEANLAAMRAYRSMVQAAINNIART
jgi:flagellar basal-body rod protein FlgC